MGDDLLDLEERLLQAIARPDLEAAAALLAEDLLVTTAGWIAEPADRSTWLAGLAGHQLDEFDLRGLATRSFGEVTVALVESTQSGRRAGEPWHHTFRYTDVWRRTQTGWVLAVRHASVVRPAAAGAAAESSPGLPPQGGGGDA